MSVTVPVAQSEQGRLRCPPRPSPWGLAWLLPLYAYFGVFRLTDSPLVDRVVHLCAGVAIYVLYVRLREHRSVRELRGGAQAAGELGLGVALGIVAIVTLVGIIWMGGSLHVLGFNDWREFPFTLGTAVLFVAPPVSEELLSRGIILRYAELWLGSWLALGLSSLLFAAAHFLSGAQSPQLFLQRVAAGALYGAAYLLTRRLWMSIGIHFGMNAAAWLTFGGNGITAIPILGWTGNSGWILFVRPALEFALAGMLLVLAQRRGRLAGPGRAWQLQCGADAEEKPQAPSNTSPPLPTSGDVAAAGSAEVDSPGVLIGRSDPR